MTLLSFLLFSLHFLCSSVIYLLFLLSGALEKQVDTETDKTVKEKTTPSQESVPPYELDLSVAVVQYGYASKMKRAEVLHKFLCYVVYNYEGGCSTGSLSTNGYCEKSG